ncbi:MAG: hypothetical protein SFV54_07485 [Bryobacteraceae bacterium]|nr:hypothetical protein [Bryobacteraceae bacterium]
MQVEIFWTVAVAVLLSAIVLVAVLSRAARGRGHLGFQLAAVFSFWSVHWLGTVGHGLPWYCNSNSEFTLIGAVECAWAMGAMTLGMLVCPWLAPAKRTAGPASPPRPPSALPIVCIGLGVFFELSAGVLSAIPSSTAVLITLKGLTLAGLMLKIWDSMLQGRPVVAMRWTILSLMIPLVGMIGGGFAGSGLANAALVFLFALSCIPGKTLRPAIVLAPILFYCSLSLVLNYLANRTELRARVWGGESYDARIAWLSEVATNFEWFSITEPRHLDLLDGRLNQNSLVGAAVNYTSRTGQYANGETVVSAFLAMIPRVIWPDKPPNSTNAAVTKYTGLEFADGTSVGIGQVMEFYINYGRTGVVAGFFLLGLVYSLLDLTLHRSLLSGEFGRFVSYFLIAVATLQLINSLAELMASIAAGLVLRPLLNAGFRAWNAVRRPATAPAPAG